MVAVKIATAALFFLWAPLAGQASAVESEPTMPSGSYQPRATILVVPGEILPEDLGVIDAAAVGLMNPGLGEVGPEQTWLDVSQGARTFDAKYDSPLNTMLATPPFVRGWEKTLLRAQSSGRDIRPGLLASILRRNGLLPAAAGLGTGGFRAAFAVVARNGRLTAAPARCPGPDCDLPLVVARVSLSKAEALADRRARGELLIVVEAPPASDGEQLSIAIAGPGFEGMLSSASTRTPGYVLSTDIAPTVISHFALPVPRAMTGLEIESGGSVDYAALAALEGRYRQVGESRGSAVLFPLVAWLLIATGLIFGSRRRLAAPVLSVLCLSVILLPAALLLTAALTPSAALESVIAGLLPVAAAALILRRTPGWPGLALACAITVTAFAIDLVAGLALTPKAVIGPNPGLGARFYGIGNELESTLMVLTSVGTGAAILAWGGSLAARSQASVFLATGAAGTIVFASGQFGADVGAAIIFPVAAVVAVAFVLGRPRLIWLGAFAALAALILLALTDTVTGNETHFVRSLLEGGSSDSAIEVMANRLESTAESFTRLSRLPVTVLALVMIGFAWAKRDRIMRLLDGLDPLRAGLAAAAAGSLVGALTNDSGALFIQVGVLYLGLALAFIWAARPIGTGS